MGSTAAAVTALVAPLLLPPGVQRGSKAAEIFLGSHHHTGQCSLLENTLPGLLFLVHIVYSKKNILIGVNCHIISIICQTLI